MRCTYREFWLLKGPPQNVTLANAAKFGKIYPFALRSVQTQNLAFPGAGCAARPRCFRTRRGRARRPAQKKTVSIGLGVSGERCWAAGLTPAECIFARNEKLFFFFFVFFLFCRLLI